MKIYLENDLFKVDVNKVGAELCSFKSKQSDIEYIWQGDAKIWGSHAPVLFPIVGGLKNDTYFFDGKEYSLPRHGFIRKNDQLEVVNHTNKELLLQLSSNASTRQVYPFEFIFQIKFQLSNNRLLISHHIINTDQKELYFSLGAHPAFNCPLLPGENYEDYELVFDQEESLHTWNLDAAGQILEEGDKIMNHSHQIALHKDLFNQDALIFKSLKSRRVGLAHKVKGERLAVGFSDFKSLGLWAKPAAPFVCIEPWLGYADASNSQQQLQEKEGILHISPQKEFKASYYIEISHEKND